MDKKTDKNIKVIVATIIAVFLMGIFLFFFNREKEIQIPIDINIPKNIILEESGEEIKFEWTDDNKGEDLIIQSDKKSYFGINKSEIYFSVSNLNKNAQNFNLRFLFGEESAKLEKIEKINSGGTTSELSLSENTFVKFDNMDGFKSSLYVGDNIQLGQTNYYKAVIAYNPNTKGEFYIEAKGDKGAYGLLDPWYNSTGLVGYWSFDGDDMDWSATTAEVIDRSGQGNNGDATNMTSASVDIGRVGQALEFDGSEDYVNAGDPVDDSLDMGIADFSVSAWIKTSSSAKEYILDKRSGGYTTGGRGFSFGISTSLICGIGDGTNYLSDSTSIGTDPINDGKWHHVVAIFDKSDVVKGYIDGVYQKEVSVSSVGDVNNSENFIIGKKSYADIDFFNGSIDEVAVFNRALSADEISALYKLGARKSQVKTTGSNKMKINTSIVNRLTSGLVGHWTFDGADMDWSSTTAEVLDRSGNGNNGDVFGETKSAIGKIGQALEFNGQNDYVLLNNPQITGSEVSTFVSWFKVDDPSRLQMILYWGNFSDYLGMMQVIHASTAKCGGTYNTINYWVDTETVVAGEWNHLVCVYDGTNVLAYLNGVYYGSKVYPAAVTSGPLYLSRYDATKYLNGSIDEVRIYNRALSPTEITELYQMGAKKFKIK